jgi:benzoylformate decarboxylase
MSTKDTRETVRDVTYQLLREFGLTTVFGNVGSTEESFLKNFPTDFRYVLAPQEASMIAMGNLITAFQNKTPLIVTAGQQTREMLLMEPWLRNAEDTMLSTPYVMAQQMCSSTCARRQS